MARILSRGLRFLDAIFQIEGGEVSTQELDLSGVQLTMDVANVAAAGRAPGNAHGSAWAILNGGWDDGEVDPDTLNPYTGISLAGTAAGTAPWPRPLPDEFRLWITQVSFNGETDAAAVTNLEAALSLLYSSNAQGVASLSGVINNTIGGTGGLGSLQSSRDILHRVTSADWIPLLRSADSVDSLLVVLPQPIPIPRGARLRLQASHTIGDDTGYMEAHVHLHCLPVGVLP